MLLCCFTLSAQQSMQVRGTVIHRGDKQPMVGAEVTVKGTTISTVTDVDGHFVLEVPTDVRKLEVTYVGMAKATVTIKEDEEVVVAMRTPEKKLMPFVVGSVMISSLKATEGEGAFSNGVGYGIGVGLTWNITRRIAFSPALHLAKLQVEGDKFSPLYLQVPLMMEFGTWIGNSCKFSYGIGPFFSIGIGGKYTAGDKEINPFFNSGNYDTAPCEILDIGLRASLNLQWRHALVGFFANIGCADVFIEQKDNANYKNRQFGVTLGYRF